MLGRVPSAEGQGQFTVTMQKHIHFIPIFIPQSQDIPIWEYTFTYGMFTLISVSGDPKVRETLAWTPKFQLPGVNVCNGVSVNQESGSEQHLNKG